MEIARSEAEPPRQDFNHAILKRQLTRIAYSWETLRGIGSGVKANRRLLHSGGTHLKQFPNKIIKMGLWRRFRVRIWSLAK